MIRVLRSGFFIVTTCVAAALPAEAGAGQVLYIAQGNNTVASVGSSGGTPTVFSTGYTDPFGMAVDAGGNVYTSNLTAGTISVVGPDGGAATTFATGFNHPDGMNFDSSGNLFVANSYGNSISEISPGGVVSTFATNLTNPVNVAFDSAGNVYYSGAGGVFEIPSGGGSPVLYSGTTTLGAYRAAVGLAFDSSGNLYVSDPGYGDVFKIAPGGGTAAVFASGLAGPSGIAFDSSGDLFTSNYGTGANGTGSVSEITPGGVVSTFATGLSQPQFLAFSPAVVPEPSSLILAGIAACLGLGYSVIRRQLAGREPTSVE